MPHKGTQGVSYTVSLSTSDIDIYTYIQQVYSINYIMNV